MSQLRRIQRKQSHNVSSNYNTCIIDISSLFIIICKCTDDIINQSYCIKFVEEAIVEEDSVETATMLPSLQYDVCNVDN